MGENPEGDSKTNFFKYINICKFTYGWNAPWLGSWEFSGGGGAGKFVGRIGVGWITGSGNSSESLESSFSRCTDKLGVLFDGVFRFLNLLVEFVFIQTILIFRNSGARINYAEKWKYREFF